MRAGGSPRIRSQPAPAGPGTPSRTRGTLVVAAGLAAFWLAIRAAGPLVPAAGLVLALIAAWVLAGLVLAHEPARRPVGWALVCAPLTMLAGARLDRGHGELGAVLGLLVVMLAVTRVPARSLVGRCGHAVARAVALSAGIWLLSLHVPAAHAAIESLAALVCGLAGLLGADIELGPTYAGVWAGILHGSLGLVTALTGLDRRPACVLGRAAVVVLVCLAALVIHVRLLPALADGVSRAAAGLLAGPGQHRLYQPDRALIMSFLGVVPLLALAPAACWWIGRQPVPSSTPRPGSARRVPVLCAGAALLVSGVYLASAQPVLHPGPGRVIGFHAAADIDFSRGISGRHGLTGAGMFGWYRFVLERSGYQVRELPARYGPEALRGVDAVIVIDPREVPPARTRHAIWAHVRDGGGLLVMGSHREAPDTRQPMDRLLAPIGVTIERDAALPVAAHWRHGQALRPHPIGAGVMTAGDIQIGMGSSLRLHGAAAEPVILGRYGFGDRGSRASGGQGGFSGDHAYQPGERLGDLVLVAQARYGAGRVLAFGDTSPFQALALPHSMDFVLAATRFVTARGAGTRPWIGVALACMGLCMLVAWQGRRGLVLASALATGAVWLHGLERAPSGLDPDIASIAIVDAQPVQRFPAQRLEDVATRGALAAMYRTGHVPLACESCARRYLDAARLVAYINPTRAPDPDTLDRLRRLLERGGMLLVAGGPPGLQAQNRLLSLCGMRLGTWPQGPARSMWHGVELRFVDAWPVLSEHERFVAHADVDGTALVGETRVGRGRCIAFGDTRFFSDGNLEGERRRYRANVLFVESLLRGAIRDGQE